MNQDRKSRQYQRFFKAFKRPAPRHCSCAVHLHPRPWVHAPCRTTNPSQEDSRPVHRRSSSNPELMVRTRVLEEDGQPVRWSSEDRGHHHQHKLNTLYKEARILKDALNSVRKGENLSNGTSNLIKKWSQKESPKKHKSEGKNTDERPRKSCGKQRIPAKENEGVEVLNRSLCEAQQEEEALRQELQNLRQGSLMYDEENKKLRRKVRQLQRRLKRQEKAPRASQESLGGDPASGTHHHYISSSLKKKYEDLLQYVLKVEAENQKLKSLTGVSGEGEGRDSDHEPRPTVGPSATATLRHELDVLREEVLRKDEMVVELEQRLLASDALKEENLALHNTLHDLYASTRFHPAEDHIPPTLEEEWVRRMAGTRETYEQVVQGFRDQLEDMEEKMAHGEENHARNNLRLQETIHLLEERLEAERCRAENLEAERLEAERCRAENLEAERLEAERCRAENLEAERCRAKNLEAERCKTESLETERLEAERYRAERQEAERYRAEGLEKKAPEGKSSDPSQREKVSISSESEVSVDVLEEKGRKRGRGRVELKSNRQAERKDENAEREGDTEEELVGADFEREDKEMAGREQSLHLDESDTRSHSSPGSDKAQQTSPRGREQGMNTEEQGIDREEEMDKEDQDKPCDKADKDSRESGVVHERETAKYIDTLNSLVERLERLGVEGMEDPASVIKEAINSCLQEWRDSFQSQQQMEEQKFLSQKKDLEDLQKKYKSKQKKLETCQKQIKDLEIYNEKLSHRCKELENQISAIGVGEKLEVLQDLPQALHTTEQRLSEAREALHQAHTEKTLLQDQVLQLGERLSKKDGKLKQEREQRTQSEKGKENLKEKLTALEQKIGECGREEGRLRELLATKDGLLERTSAQLEERIRECAALSSEIERSHRDWTAERERIQSGVTERDGVASKQFADAQAQVARTQAQLSALRSEKEQTQKSLRQQLRKLEDQVDGLQLRNSTLQRQLSTITSTYHSMFSSVDIHTPAMTLP